MLKRKLPWLLALGLVFSVACAHGQVKKDVPYVPTPESVVETMLKTADVKSTDKLYDLGCGDGRIVVTAAKKYGATATGVDIDPQRIKESNENAKAAGVTDKVKFTEGNLFEMDFSDATVVTMYLLPSVNMKLRPKILDLKPGTRIVSHAFDMEDWKPEKQLTVQPGQQTVYFWIVPAKVDGTWTATFGDKQGSLHLKQEFQEVTGTARIGDKEHQLSNVKLTGPTLTFSVNGETYTAQVKDKELTGTGKAQGATLSAKKQ